MVPPQFDELVQESDYIVRAIVTSVSSRWEERRGDRLIITYVSLEVVEKIAGEVPDAPVLQMLGGEVGADQMEVEGAPRFEVGDEEILFVQGNGRRVSPLTAMMHGRYRVVSDPASGSTHVARDNGEKLTEVEEVAKPMSTANHHSHEAGVAAALPSKVALSPQQFIRLIREARNQPED
ncbi:MAG: hypothetical protein SynsKO_35000 [Synoicihabitans sp.]